MSSKNLKILKKPKNPEKYSRILIFPVLMGWLNSATSSQHQKKSENSTNIPKITSPNSKKTSKSLLFRKNPDIPIHSVNILNNSNFCKFF
jgi:hypothetical protein